jgi:ESF2/ABP1 family protein
LGFHYTISGNYLSTVKMKKSKPSSDPRFAFSKDVESNSNDNASSSKVHSSDEEDDRGISQGMEPEGFAGPKIVQPLTPEALAKFNAAQARTGVIYISRIPPGMRPAKVRHLMSAHGEVGRVYLQQEGVSALHHAIAH